MNDMRLRLRIVVHEYGHDYLNEHQSPFHILREDPTEEVVCDVLAGLVLHYEGVEHIEETSGWFLAPWAELDPAAIRKVAHYASAALFYIHEHNTQG